jgi:hypothetical protein
VKAPRWRERRSAGWLPGGRAHARGGQTPQPGGPVSDARTSGPQEASAPDDATGRAAIPERSHQPNAVCLAAACLMATAGLAGSGQAARGVAERTAPAGLLGEQVRAAGSWLSTKPLLAVALGGQWARAISLVLRVRSRPARN